MTRRDRIRMTLKGERTDRPPMSLWRHFYDREGSAESLADAIEVYLADYERKTGGPATSGGRRD